MKIRYVYSACVVTETEDVRICTDPWFSPGAYDGSWFQYPPLPTDPLEVIGQVDVIYVSHIHPDHYDPTFLRRYLERHPSTELLIGYTEPPYLLNKMRLDGFTPQVVKTAQYGHTKLFILPNKGYEGYHIDTALVIRKGNLSIANLNDNLFDAEQVAMIRALCPSDRPTVALLPYSGAGPYPQTYMFESLDDLRRAADRKCQEFLNLYLRYIEALNPIKAIPFAGKYWLGGPLAELNDWRGVPDATTTISLCPDVTVVLADGGHSVLDVETLKASSVRTSPYDRKAIVQYLAELPFQGYDYELELRPLPDRALPLVPLTQTAFQQAMKESRIKDPIWYCILPLGWDRYITFEPAEGKTPHLADTISKLVPRLEISIDSRYLFGLLTRLYHWNNAETGSHYRCRRVPNVFRREVREFLNNFHV